MKRSTVVDDFSGLDVNTPPELLHPQRFARDENGDRRRSTSWRPRRGYERLLDVAGTGISFGQVAEVVLAFERDDQSVMLVTSGGADVGAEELS